MLEGLEERRRHRFGDGRHDAARRQGRHQSVRHLGHEAVVEARRVRVDEARLVRSAPLAPAYPCVGEIEPDALRDGCREVEARRRRRGDRIADGIVDGATTATRPAAPRSVVVLVREHGRVCVQPLDHLEALALPPRVEERGGGRRVAFARAQVEEGVAIRRPVAKAVRLSGRARERERGGGSEGREERWQLAVSEPYLARSSMAPIVSNGVVP